MSNKVRSLAKAREKLEAKTSTITASLSQLLGSIPAMNELVIQPIPIRTSFQIGKIAKALNAETQQFNESRTTLCERYANKDKDDKPIMIEVEGGKSQYDIPKGKQAEFDKEIDDLRAMEVQIPGHQVKVSELGAVNISPALLLDLEWLIIGD